MSAKVINCDSKPTARDSTLQKVSTLAAAPSPSLTWTSNVVFGFSGVVNSYVRVCTL